MKATRANFVTNVAPSLAAQIGPAAPSSSAVGRGYSTRFAFFADQHGLTVVAGDHEGDDTELALAYAVRFAAGRPTSLVLPLDHHHATAQRLPWLAAANRPRLYLHDGATVVPAEQRSQQDTIDIIRAGRPADYDLARDLTAHHLADVPPHLAEFIEQISHRDDLDEAHRGGERAWHYAGQRVLSVSQRGGRIIITAGIHYSGDYAPPSVTIAPGGDLTDEDSANLCERIATAIAARQSDTPPIGRRDEHWLQAVLRRRPALVRTAPPLLREVPAWRPRDTPTHWGRGFIDLVGIDGRGDIRLIETKIEKNADDLLILQGLDYLAWAHAYENELKRWLGASKKARITLHYVIGADSDVPPHVARSTQPLADAVDPDIEWRFQIVYGWKAPPGAAHAARSELLAPGAVPST